MCGRARRRRPRRTADPRQGSVSPAPPQIPPNPAAATLLSRCRIALRSGWAQSCCCSADAFMRAVSGSRLHRNGHGRHQTRSPCSVAASENVGSLRWLSRRGDATRVLLRTLPLQMKGWWAGDVGCCLCAGCGFAACGWKSLRGGGAAQAAKRLFARCSMPN